MLRRMDAATLNLTTKVLGYGRFLFLQLNRSDADSTLLRAIEHAAAGFENAHYAYGQPAEESMQRGRIQYLRAIPQRLRKGEVEDEGVCASGAAIRLE